jgi:response regulator NasT
VTQAAESRQPQDDQDAAVSIPEPTKPGHRVLIAEDEALIRLDLAEMLREEGYQVIAESGDGESAIELARDLRPNLVIMDIKMPKVDGISAASVIVKERIAPVVMLTAFSQRDLIEQARDAGAMAYLVKPFARHELVPAIELSVSRFAELRALENEVESLNDRLETRKVIDRAKGLLMTNHAMTEPEAFRWIQRTAMDRRSTMKVVAEAIVNGLDAPAETA